MYPDEAETRQRLPHRFETNYSVAHRGARDAATGGASIKKPPGMRRPTARVVRAQIGMALTTSVIVRNFRPASIGTPERG
jgi:hypothetical protein